MYRSHKSRAFYPTVSDLNPTMMGQQQQQQQQQAGHACTACQTMFDDPDKQRKHYKTDWHRSVVLVHSESTLK